MPERLSSEPDGAEAGGARSAAGLALASAALLLLEVAATRLLSFVSWHHFAFMVVSVAMLGLGAASVVVSVWRRLAAVPLERVCSVSGVALAAAVPLSYAVLVTARFSPAVLSSDLGGQLLRLGATYVGLLLPFFAGGVLVASCLTRLAPRAPLLYGADLLGAAVGCLAGVVLAGPLSTEQAFLLAGVLAGLASAVFAARRRRDLVLGLAAALAATAACWALPWALPARAAEGKTLWYILEEARPEGRVLATHNTPVGRVDVVEGGGPSGWSENPRAPGSGLPEQLHLLIDGEADTPVALVGPDAPDGLDYLDSLPSSFVYAARRPERVLVVGAGGGQDVLAALRHGAARVDAVELNPAIVELMRGRLAEGSGGLFERPGVRLIRAEGRSFVRGARSEYDVIELGLVDTWAATSTGGLSLSESFLYTVDAFEDYLEALRPGGMVSVTRWLHDPPRETLRLAVLAAEALARRGSEDPGRHMVVVGVGRVGALVVAREPLGVEDLHRLARLAHERRLDVHWAPGVPWPEDNAFARLLDPRRDRDAFVAGYEYDVSPVTDDRPFYFDFNTPRDRSTLALLGDPRRLALSGSATVLAVLVQAGLLAAVLLFLPLATRRVRLRGGGGPALGYFLLTGTAFMFVEVPLLQRSTLLVGHPSHAVALVLGVLLASSGAGSLWSRRLLADRRGRVRLVLVLLAGLVGLEAAAGGWISELGLAAPAWARPLLAGLLVAPLGVLMGMPTPFALRALAADRREALLPLCWAATSFASVLGSILSVAVAMRHGFGGALAVGAAGYLLAAPLAPGRGAGR